MPTFGTKYLVAVNYKYCHYEENTNQPVSVSYSIVLHANSLWRKNGRSVWHTLQPLGTGRNGCKHRASVYFRRR